MGMVPTIFKVMWPLGKTTDPVCFPFLSSLFTVRVPLHRSVHQAGLKTSSPSSASWRMPKASSTLLSWTTFPPWSSHILKGTVVRGLVLTRKLLTATVVRFVAILCVPPWLYVWQSMIGGSVYLPVLLSNLVHKPIVVRGRTVCYWCVDCLPAQFFMSIIIYCHEICQKYLSSPLGWIQYTDVIFRPVGLC